MARPPYRHPRTNKPACRLDRGRVYWFGCRAAHLEARDNGTMVVPRTGAPWPKPRTPDVLRHFAGFWALPVDDSEGNLVIAYLGDPVTRVIRLPDGCTVNGRWFPEPMAAAKAVADIGRAPDPRPIALVETHNRGTFDVRVNEVSVGRLEIPANGDPILRHGSGNQSFGRVSSALRHVGEKYAIPDPVG